MIIVSATKVAKKNKKETGLKIELGDVVITQKDPLNVIVTYHKRNSYFPTIERAANYVIKLKTLDSGLYTDLQSFLSQYRKEQAKVMSALGNLPF